MIHCETALFYVEIEVVKVFLRRNIKIQLTPLIESPFDQATVFGYYYNVG